ncbi:hypothetical protein K502DRAFT_289010 [Neoconidiobolus thromboides FSU 785]|nr:hypothetical protein K502DRAFT_289010 [Neoconidiobolus thromboides FSU 785]
MIFNTENKYQLEHNIQKNQLNILLLENINPTAINIFNKQGFNVESHTKALSEEELIEKIQTVHVIGIRSKTKLTEKVLSSARNLLAIGCFCIGTNQVDLNYAEKRGIPVFNSPFSNSRSVAELVLAHIIYLSRQMGDRNQEMHNGLWNKVSKNCYEVRNKKLGIIGYGHIGSQLSVLAESLGIQVYFYDILQIMPLGTATQITKLEDLLGMCDFITLHVPETKDTKEMIGERELKLMKKGSYLINYSRGTVVQLNHLAEALKSGHLAGAAIDVFPVEPSKNGEAFTNELIGCPNTILSPHIGGSTEEAQSMIGIEVGTSITKYLNIGTTLSAVNFPNLELRPRVLQEGNIVRVIFVHDNVPGVLKEINNLLSDYNVERQSSDSKGSVAYLIADIVPPTKSEEEIKSHLHELYHQISKVKHGILTRLII